jgi:hypothetical protein
MAPAPTTVILMSVLPVARLFLARHRRQAKR